MFEIIQDSFVFNLQIRFFLVAKQLEQQVSHMCWSHLELSLSLSTWRYDNMAVVTWYRRYKTELWTYHTNSIIYEDFGSTIEILHEMITILRNKEYSGTDVSVQPVKIALVDILYILIMQIL